VPVVPHFDLKGTRAWHKKHLQEPSVPLQTTDAEKPEALSRRRDGGPNLGLSDGNSGISTMAATFRGVSRNQSQSDAWQSLGERHGFVGLLQSAKSHGCRQPETICKKPKPLGSNLPACLRAPRSVWRSTASKPMRDSGYYERSGRIAHLPTAAGERIRIWLFECYLCQLERQPMESGVHPKSDGASGGRLRST